MGIQGTTVVDFGSTPVDSATFAVIDAGLSGLTYAEAWIMRDSTASNSVDEHETLGAMMRIMCSIAATTLTLYCELLGGFVSGQVSIRYVAN